jgi:F-type H+-transporting ATPase subunit beta
MVLSTRLNFMTQPCGTITRVRGSVVDVHFSKCLPGLYHELATDPEGCVIEVRAHLDAHTIRGIALTPTKGLWRGASVRDTGHLLRVPVGNQVLGRALSVLGEPLDGNPPLPHGDGVEWRAVQHPPLPLSDYTTSRDIFQTGIKVIDLLCPLERGEKPASSVGPAWARRC